MFFIKKNEKNENAISKAPNHVRNEQSNDKDSPIPSNIANSNLTSQTSNFSNTTNSVKTTNTVNAANPKNQKKTNKRIVQWTASQPLEIQEKQTPFISQEVQITQKEATQEVPEKDELYRFFYQHEIFAGETLKLMCDKVVVIMPHTIKQYEGDIFLTNYRVIFKIQGNSQFILNQLQLRKDFFSLPYQLIRKMKKNTQQLNIELKTKDFRQLQYQFLISQIQIFNRIVEALQSNYKAAYKKDLFSFIHGNNKKNCQKQIQSLQIDQKINAITEDND